MRTATYFSWMQSFSKNKLWSRNGPAMSFQVSHFRVVALFSCLFHFFFPMCIWCQTKIPTLFVIVLDHLSDQEWMPPQRRMDSSAIRQEPAILQAPGSSTCDEHHNHSTHSHSMRPPKRVTHSDCEIPGISRVLVLMEAVTRTSKDVYPRGRPIITYSLRENPPI